MRKILISAACFLIFGCGDPRYLTASEKPVAVVKAPEPIVDYGNGVLFFPYSNQEFGRRLSNYLAAHPNLSVVSVSDVPVSSSYNGSAGYFVIVREAARA